MSFIKFFAQETWTHALFDIWNIILLFMLCPFCNIGWSRWELFTILLLVRRLILEILFLRNLLLHWASSSICRDGLLALCFYPLGIKLLRTFFLSIWCSSKQWRSDTILKHWLPIKFNFKRFSLLNHFVDSFAKVSGFKMSSSFRALIFLACVIIGIDTFVVVKINILFTIGLIFHLLLLIFEIVLVILIVWQLV